MGKLIKKNLKEYMHINLARVEIEKYFEQWLVAWNNHDINGVMKFIHDEITFENWDGRVISGKTNLKKSWGLWFMHHGNFKFMPEDVFMDEANQKMTFAWTLEWPSLEKKYVGKREKRRGVDILYLREGKIFRKDTYSKTTIEIDSLLVRMHTE